MLKRILQCISISFVLLCLFMPLQAALGTTFGILVGIFMIAYILGDDKEDKDSE